MIESKRQTEINLETKIDRQKETDEIYNRVRQTVGDVQKNIKINRQQKTDRNKSRDKNRH